MLQVQYLIGELICQQIDQELDHEYFKGRKFFEGAAVKDHSGKYLGLCESIEIYPSGFTVVKIRVR